MSALLVVAVSGQLAIGVVFVVIFLGLAYGLYSRRDSNISQHPQGAERSGAPGVGEGPSRIAGSEDGEQEPFSSRGTS